MTKLFKFKGEGPKVLLLDIETSPIISYTWGLFDQNVGLEQIKQDSNIISWSAKWLGSPDNEIMYADQRNAKDVHDDKELLKGIWKLLDECDVVVGQNSNAFDLKRLNARFIINGYKPPSGYKKVDTLQIARTKFGFTSNKLAFLTKKLCNTHKKSEHKKFSGFSLWLECLKGNRQAWLEMEHYNKKDVLSLEELYLKLRAWATNLPNPNLYHDAYHAVCTCGSKKFQRNGYAYTASGKYQRYKCVSCGAETRDKKNILDKEKRASLRART